MEMKIDGSYDYSHDYLWTVEPFKSNGLLFVGGLPGQSSNSADIISGGFGGCMSSILIDSKQLYIHGSAKSYDEKNTECRRL